MSQENFDSFRNLVLQDSVLQQALRDITDYPTFTKLLVKLGNERGYNFTAEDVESAFNSSRRAWFERWIDR